MRFIFAIVITFFLIINEIPFKIYEISIVLDQMPSGSLLMIILKIKTVNSSFVIFQTPP